MFVAVVDPGVGSSRRGLAIEAGPYRFVGPDNGLMTAVLDDHPTARVHALTNRRLWRAEVASTFHARDVFGPVAAHLALGLGLDEVGPPVSDVCGRLPLVPIRALGRDKWEGTILQVDRFGNLTCNVSARALDDILSAADADRSDVVVVVTGVVAPLVLTYADVPPGEACALLGSQRPARVRRERGSAASILGAGRGAPVRIRRVYQPAI